MKKVVFKKNVTKEYNKNGIYIEKGCFIERGATIWSNNVILSGCKIYSGAELLPFNVVENCEIGSGSRVGPFAHLRPQTKIDKDCRIGNFVEIKKSTIGSGSKISHLTYVGDGEIGNDCNIGCGVVFCNYDGKNKHKTVLKDRVFVGCNSNLIAPVCLEKESFVAAGTTVTNNLPANALAIGRVRQITKEKYKNNKYIKDK